MTRFDFWNNPLVVSAFRLKGKKQFPLAAYVVVLIGIGAGLEYFSRNAARPWSHPWPQIHLAVVVTLTATISFLFAMISTQASINSEVANKTLDFQRITGLSPAQVVVGKLFGDPALAYLLIPASFPVALFGVLRSDTLNIGSLLTVYIDLVAFAILGGASGLLHPLETTSNKPTGGGAAAGWAIMFMIAAPYVIGSGFFISSSPTAGFVLGTFTPAPIIAGLFDGDVWKYSLHLFDRSIPYAVYSPIAHLTLAFLLFSIMARRLKNPVETPLPKHLAYLAVALADFLIVGFLIGEDPLKKLTAVGYNVASFAVAHTILSLIFTFCMTPNREGVDSWIWKLRRVNHDWRDWLLGNRSPNLLAVVALALIGLAAECLLLASSGRVAAGMTDVNSLGEDRAPFANWVGVGVALLLLVSFGFVAQAASLAFKRMPAFFLVGTSYLLVGMLLAGAGKNFKLAFAASLSPFGQLVAWMDPREFAEVGISPIPYFVLFSLLAGSGMLLVLRYLKGYKRIVAMKLRGMGIGPDVQGGEPPSTRPS